MESRRKLRRLVTLSGLIAIAFCALGGTRWAIAGDDPSPVGVWSTDGNDSHVKIEKCGTNLCGTIVWLKDPLGDDGKPAVDSKNPDPSLRTQKLVGLRLLSGFEQADGDPNVWKGGTIYDPDDGRTYSCNLTVQDQKTLKVRGYVGFSLLGKTQIWNRVQ
jgi:uncharacterized protein (DUF2147 family)